MSAAKLLCESHHNRVTKENSNLFEAEHRRERRNNVRLQIPHRGRENSLFVWCVDVQRDVELILRSAKMSGVFLNLWFYSKVATALL